MKSHRDMLFICGVILLTVSSCTRYRVSVIPDETPASCHIMYDAGSSGTRLYIYEQQGPDLIEHEGPKVSALADPVREIRGKRWQDVDAVTTEVVSALDAIRYTGPRDDKGHPKWDAFDWTRRCGIASAAIYATAGMRIAEQEHQERSVKLWNMLNHKLQTRVGDSVKVRTRTLSGYEEGLYAWLAVREMMGAHNFGIVEMGGASSQITFPCPECDGVTDAVKAIIIADQVIQVYSYSYLGLGQDEAPKSLGLPASCEYGIGTMQADWTVADCATQIVLEDA